MTPELCSYLAARLADDFVTLGRMEGDIRRDLAAVSDSPAFVDGKFVTSGGFHVTCQLFVCRQSWALRPEGPAAGLEKYVSAIVEIVPVVDRDRPLGEDIERIVAMLSAGKLA